MEQCAETYLYLSCPIFGSPSFRSLNRNTDVCMHSPNLLPSMCKLAKLCLSKSLHTCSPTINIETTNNLNLMLNKLCNYENFMIMKIVMNSYYIIKFYIVYLFY